MKHSSRRILALLLALSLCIGMMPMSIFAEPETEAINEQSEEKIELSQSETDDSADLEEESEGVDVFETDAKGAPEAAKKADVRVLEEKKVDLEKVEEDAPSAGSSSFLDVLKLLGIPTVLLFFLGIVSHVGIDVGVNTAAPKILIERLGLPLTEAAIATSVYFLFRTIGCFTGSIILAKWDLKKFFALSVALMIISMIGLFVCQTKIGIYIAIACVGYGNSNIFSMIFSKALLFMPDKKNEMSGLMIMGLIGGTIFPLLMGVLSDALGSQIGSVIVISCGVAYLIFLAAKFMKEQKA